MTFIACLPAAAQYSIDWSTVDGGGGTSTGGDYMLSGTIGQPDTGTVSGGNFALNGGFWSILAVVENPESPTLTILRKIPDSVVISWPSSGIEWSLEQRSDLGKGGWSATGDAPVKIGGDLQVTIPTLDTAGYYRLREP
jgi:hypothetical protein